MKSRSAAGRIAATGALALGLVAASSSTEAAPDAGATISDLSVGIPAEVSNLDGGQGAVAAFSNQVVSLSLEPLLRRGDDGELEPWLAEEVVQPSDTVYEYHLRQDVTFWDGNELTADDVVASWEHFREGVPSYYESVESIAAVDRHTVRVTLTQPDPRWKYTPASSAGAVFEKQFFEEHEETYGQPGTLVMGTGPWIVETLNPTSGAELSANPDYWGGEVPIEHISFHFFSDPNSMALAVRAGDVDIAPLVQDVTSFEAASGIEVSSAPTCHLALLTMPTQTPPWDDVHVRRAVAHAINRDDVIAASGFPASPAYTLIAPSQLETIGAPEGDVEAALASLPAYELDLEAARAELAQSAYPDGFSTELLTFDYGGFLAVDQVIAAQLAEIGIDIEINDIGQAAWFEVLHGPAAERPLTYTTVGGCDPDPSFYNTLLGTDDLEDGGNNWANWAPPEVDDLLATGLIETDPAERLAIYTELLELLATDVPYLPLLVGDASYASPTFDWPTFDEDYPFRPWALELVPK